MLNIKRALISVYDKTGVVCLARELVKNNVEILSTGGTYSLLKANNINVIDITEYTGSPEMMSGRVKTLNPKIHGGILGRRDIDASIMKEHNILEIDLVVVNLYPFIETVSKPNVKLSEAIENIDIGGPAMIRSASKNYKDVVIVTDQKDYSLISDSFLKNNLTLDVRFKLACKAFEYTARYDGAIANYLGQINSEGEKRFFPNTINNQYTLIQNLRYGENPHQKAAFYIDNINQELSVSTSKQIQGKELSYNNIVDADTALECVKSFIEPACVIVKHSNPCGVGSSDNKDDILDAYKKAFDTDRESAFGGIIAFNRNLDKNTVKLILQNQFVEVVIAPSIDNDALDIFRTKPNIRILVYQKFDSQYSNSLDYKKVVGGMLVQTRDVDIISASDLEIVTQKQPTEHQISDLLFAWKVAKFVKSNAIVFAKNNQILAIGAGQMSRVNSTRIAQIKAEIAGLSLKDSCLASDAFFPFKDGVEQAIKFGATAIIQPGGSIRDNEVIEACDKAGVVMVFTNMRHFRH